MWSNLRNRHFSHLADLFTDKIALYFVSKFVYNLSLSSLSLSYPYAA